MKFTSIWALAACWVFGGASKILLQPFPWFSHINEIGEIGRALKCIVKHYFLLFCAKISSENVREVKRV